MTQSKKDDGHITIDVGALDDYMSSSDTITINLDDTYGTTTTYWAGDSVTDITYSGVDTTIDIGNYTLSGDFGPIDWTAWEGIKPEDVEKMCKHYPGLEKVWRNFKSVYDMCKQDYEGKKKAGEIDDDDIPF